MRKIGDLANETQAHFLADYLIFQKIENTVEPEENGGWALWIHDDKDLDKARTILESFFRDPHNPEFSKGALQGKLFRSRKKVEEQKSRAKTIDIRTSWHLQRTRMGKLTLALIGISIGVALISQLGANRAILRPLFITNYEVVGGYIQWRVGLPEILHGQIWRLITPIFIHFGLLHLVFNMLWLNDLGNMIERHQGPWMLGIQVVVIAALSNVGQYLMSGPTFGGMSGVVYGLLGYIWIRGRFDPRSGLYLHKTIVIWMMAWFVLCLTGLIGHVANTAHGVGLAVGMAWGYLSSGHWSKILKR